jgi:hypothetical protein
MIDLIKVQKFIFDRISQLSYTIVDDFAIYEQAKTPYIQLSNLYIDNDNTKNTEGMVIQQYINVYSSYKGKKEILQIAQAISSVMNGKAEIEEYSVYIEEDTKTIMLDFDNNGNIFYHSVMIFKIHIQ